VNEAKLANAIRARWLKPATVDEIRTAGAEPGYASPLGIDRERALVVLDDLVVASPNLVSGANEEGFHFLDVNAGRDYEPDAVADLATAPDGAPCERCGGALRHVRGIEVGNIFQLGTRYSAALGATYLDAEGQAHPVIMGSYGIGVGRLLACVAEAHHDERGLCLPITVAPFDLYLVCLSKREEAALREQAERLYDELRAAGGDVLYDDRDLSAGVKFTDADLMGIPLRATVSERARRGGGVELKRRDAGAATLVPLDAAVAGIRAALAALHAEAAARVVGPAYPEE
jgi:prolyl-tRNA synthetase